MAGDNTAAVEAHSPSVFVENDIEVIVLVTLSRVLIVGNMMSGDFLIRKGQHK
jgi:hypothetical protein